MMEKNLFSYPLKNKTKQTEPLNTHSENLSNLCTWWPGSITQCSQGLEVKNIPYLRLTGIWISSAFWNTTWYYAPKVLKTCIYFSSLWWRFHLISGAYSISKALCSVFRSSSAPESQRASSVFVPTSCRHVTHGIEHLLPAESKHMLKR